MRIAVYTSIIGNYDNLRPANPLVAADDVSYECFADATRHHPLYTIVHVNDNTIAGDVLSKGSLSTPRGRTKASRWFKCRSHILYPDVDFTIWHGGSTRLRCSPYDLVRLLGNKDIALVKHSDRGCVYDEADACTMWKKDDVATIRAQIGRYRLANYPKHNGLHCAFLIVRRNNDNITRFNKMWWYEIDSGSVRDQLSLDYVMWKLGIKPAIISGDIHSGKCYRRYATHNE